jgi:hypothetical protein
MGFWAHFGLMTPFVTMRALWGYPWLVEAQGVPRGTAATWLAVSVASLVAAAPFVGHLGRRGPHMQVRMALATGTLLVVAWVAVLGWPGAMPPHALIVAPLAMSGVGSAVSVIAFMLARAGNPAHVAGSATGLVKLRRLPRGVRRDPRGRPPARPRRPHRGCLQHALLPMVGFPALSLMQVTRLRLQSA